MVRAEDAKPGPLDVRRLDLPLRGVRHGPGGRAASRLVHSAGQDASLGG